MTFFYRLGIGLYHSLISLMATLGKPKAKAWVAGRQAEVDWAAITPLRETGPVIWMHCSSLGEFEQGRPVLDLLRKELKGQVVVVLTFYSPSGYEHGKNYVGADLVTYLPADGQRRAQRWLTDLQPDLAIFVKYEFWHYHLKTLHDAKVPTFLIAASFRPTQIFFKPWGSWWRKLLGRFEAIMVQTKADQQLLQQISLPADRIHISGDPRIDRTLELAALSWSEPVLEQFSKGDKPLLIAGSVWPPDVDRLIAAWPTIGKYYRLLLAPHELEEAQLSFWADAFDAQRYTHLKSAAELKGEVLILDTIGLLSRTYRYGQLAYIGGGFGKSIHNTLEPMAYGLPVLFGPKISKFPEALTVVENGGAFVVETAEELSHKIEDLQVAKAYELAKDAVANFMESNKGAARRSINKMMDYLA